TKEGGEVSPPARSQSLTGRQTKMIADQSAALCRDKLVTKVVILVQVTPQQLSLALRKRRQIGHVHATDLQINQEVRPVIRIQLAIPRHIPVPKVRGKRIIHIRILPQ